MLVKVIYDLYEGNKLIGEAFCYNYQVAGTKEVFKKRGWIMKVKRTVVENN